MSHSPGTVSCEGGRTLAAVTVMAGKLRSSTEIFPRSRNSLETEPRVTIRLWGPESSWLPLRLACCLLLVSSASPKTHGLDGEQWRLWSFKAKDKMGMEHPRRIHSFITFLFCFVLFWLSEHLATSAIFVPVHCHLVVMLMSVLHKLLEGYF